MGCEMDAKSKRSARILTVWFCVSSITMSLKLIAHLSNLIAKESSKKETDVEPRIRSRVYIRLEWHGQNDWEMCFLFHIYLTDSPRDGPDSLA